MIIETQSLLDQRIIHCLNTNYGIKVETLRPLFLGADTSALAYKAIACDQSSYFIKLKGESHLKINDTIQTLLYNAGIKQIIPAIRTIHAQSTLPIDGFTLIVYPYVDGQDGFNRNLTENQWVLLGKAMRNVHEIDVPTLNLDQVRQETFSPKWREAVRSLYTKFKPEQKDDDITNQLWSFLTENAPTINRLVDRAEKLAQELQDQSHTFVLCHGDLHGGNVLLGKNDTFYILDWDDSIMAPKERDLMFIGGGVGNVWNKPQEIRAFYKGYGKADVNMPLLTYYRHERIVEDIAIYGQQILFSAGSTLDHATAYKHFMDQFKPEGVVEIAFRTDEGHENKYF